MAKLLFNVEWENLVHNIIYLRKQFKIPKYRMAKLLKISMYSLRKIEAQEIPPRLSIELIFEISRIFHIPPYRLFASRLDESWNLPETEKPVIPTERM